MKPFWLIVLSLPLIAQTVERQFPGTVTRASNPPGNVFVIQTKAIAELGAPLCLDSVVIRARLLSGDRNSEGDERFVERRYKLELIEQHNGITRPRSIDLGRGHLLNMQVVAIPLLDDFLCGTK